MLKGYKYRIYPNKQQEEQIQKTFGCCRFVYNQILKKEYEWLKEVDKFALTNSVYNMDSAYQKFFKEHSGYPTFKSKLDNKKILHNKYNR